MKQKIIDLMQTIAKEELNKETLSLQKATYNDQKTLISSLFKGTDYNTGIIMLRLVVIDSLYSTNAAYSYFSFEDMADKIYNLLGKSEKEACEYFNAIAHGEKDIHKLFDEPYGIQKNLKEGNKQMSLLSKYAYYALYKKEYYPLGFPIYDRLAIESYPTICKMLGLNIHKNIENDITKYVDALSEVRSNLFTNEDLFQDFQQYDVLDAYLWRMGKFSDGNLSLLLERNDYDRFIKNLKLQIEIDKKTKNFETDSAYKQRMTTAFSKILTPNKEGNVKFEFNDVIVRLYTDVKCHPFKGITTEKYMDQLLEHWRLFNSMR